MTPCALASVLEQPNTGVKFPVTVPGEKGSLYLLGAALRAKKIVLVSVQVYAVGLYADKAAVAKKLTREVFSCRLFTYKVVESISCLLYYELEAFSPCLPIPVNM